MFKDEDDDDNPFDEHGILKDGRTIRVSLLDAMQARGRHSAAADHFVARSLVD
jgi:hypothetical protein